MEPKGGSTRECISNTSLYFSVLAVAFVYITFMPQEEALAVLIQGTSPGGMISNIITYWINGDVNLRFIPNLST